MLAGVGCKSLSRSKVTNIAALIPYTPTLLSDIYFYSRFLIEGLITLIVGISSFFLMPASAVQTKTWFRPHGWFNDREVAIVVNRVLRDDPSKGAHPMVLSDLR